MFINFSSHPSSKWSTEQLVAASAYGAIQDIAFPNVDPRSAKEEVEALAQSFAAQIIKLSPTAVLCQGEFTLAYAVGSSLKANGILVVAACSERVSKEISENGVTKKVSEFKFVSFREF
jgi:hypothetical protein